MKYWAHLADWRWLPGSSGADCQVLLVRPAVVHHTVGVGVAEALHHSVHHEEGDDGEAGREAFPDDAGVAVPGLEGVRQEMHQSVAHQGSHGQRDEELEGGVLVRAPQEGDDAHRDEAHQGDDGYGGEPGQPGGVRYRPQPSQGPPGPPANRGRTRLSLLLQTVLAPVVCRVGPRLRVVVMICAVLLTGQGAGGQSQQHQAGQQQSAGWPHGGGGGGGDGDGEVFTDRVPSINWATPVRNSQEYAEQSRAIAHRGEEFQLTSSVQSQSAPASICE